MLPAAVVDNLPQVPPEKQEKLAAVIKRLYAHIGTIREGIPCHCNLWLSAAGEVRSAWQHFGCSLNRICNAGGFWMPSDEETKLTKGFAFIEFLTSEVSEHATPHLTESRRVWNTASRALPSCILLYSYCRKHKQPSSTPRVTAWTSGMHLKSPCSTSLTSISRSQMDTRSLKARTMHPQKTCRSVLVPRLPVLGVMNDKCCCSVLCVTCIQSSLKHCLLMYYLKTVAQKNIIWPLRLAVSIQNLPTRTILRCIKVQYTVQYKYHVP